MKVLLDTNVVLDLLLAREPWRVEAEAIAQAAADGRILAHVGASSITDIFYIGRKLVGADEARKIVRACLDTLQIVGISREILDAASRRPGGDFEDHVQAECAIAAGLDAIVTRDPEGFATSPIPAITPAQLLSRLVPLQSGS
ncbi:MAG: PIN domain-containing protein [Isosphaeraceae bacterium]